MPNKFVTTDQLNKVFSSYDLSTRNASLKESEYYNEDSIIYISDAENGNWIYAHGKLYGDDYQLKEYEPVKWVILPDTPRELELSENTIIGDNCILYCSSTLLIPTSITKFNSSYIDSKYLPDTSKYGVIIFENALTEILQVDELNTSSLFNNSDINFIKLPQSLESIGAYVFNMLDSSAQITIPENVTTLGMNCLLNVKYITIEKLQSTYRTQIMENDCSIRFLTVDDSCFINNYDVSCLFAYGSSGKSIITYKYHVYTDDETIKSQLAMAANEHTIFSIHKLNEWNVI